VCLTASLLPNRLPRGSGACSGKREGNELLRPKDTRSPRGKTRRGKRRPVRAPSPVSISGLRRVCSSPITGDCQRTGVRVEKVSGICHSKKRDKVRWREKEKKKMRNSGMSEGDRYIGYHRGDGNRRWVTGYDAGQGLSTRDSHSETSSRSRTRNSNLCPVRNWENSP